MSNTEPSSDQAIPTVDDLICSPTENIIIPLPSNHEESSSPSLLHLNSNDKTTSDADSQVTKSTIPESDIETSKEKDFHLIKWIEFNFDQLPILLQNVNGPCPLLAIFNILLLRKQVKQTFRKLITKKYFSELVFFSRLSSIQI